MTREDWTRSRPAWTPAQGASCLCSWKPGGELSPRQGRRRRDPCGVDREGLRRVGCGFGEMARQGGHLHPGTQVSAAADAAVHSLVVLRASVRAGPGASSKPSMSDPVWLQSVRAAGGQRMSRTARVEDLRKPAGLGSAPHTHSLLEVVHVEAPPPRALTAST